MVFGLQKLQNELFCVTEERNYFQSKYLEQVNEIAALKEDLRKAKREIGKLRGELMESSVSEIGGLDESLGGYSSYSTPAKHRRRSRHSATGSAANSPQANSPTAAATATATATTTVDAFQEEKKENELDQNDDVTSEKDEDLNDEEQDDEDDDDDEDTQAQDIRQSAEKLLQWASYRTYQRSSSASSPDHGSVGSPAPVEDSLLGPMIPRTIESASLDDRSTGNLSQTLSNDSETAP
ncbi:expressed unknown protein [Seminavis robusta]|uniref:Uncharacterized protein n=1 Tax=Seminavis robusta TaxID=568900 RepID=A0A9N8E008_9STRA|nr:expressed unknown protein [Seminavis robusta]|eukprot:Sro511_g157450.1 n/a (238) ;mRNA; r:33359-34072